MTALTNDAHPEMSVECAGVGGPSSPRSAAADPTCHAWPDSSSATVVRWRVDLSGSTAQAAVAAPSSPNAGPAAPTDLDAARRRKVQLRNQLARRVDARMKVLDRAAVPDVPQLYVAVCGALTAAVALRQIEAQSEHAFQECGSPWVFSSNAEWMAICSLNEDEWIGARQTLRSLGLIQERRRYEAETRRIVVDLSFVPQALHEQIDAVRRRVRDRCRSELSIG
jgi:hypothetical protein